MWQTPFFVILKLASKQSMIRFVSEFSAGPMAGASVFFKGKENRLKKEITYEKFLMLCSDTIKAMYPGAFETELCATLRNNDVEMKGILVKQQGEPLAPNFYLMEQFHAWLEDRVSLGEIAGEICCIYYDELEKNRKIAEELKFVWEEFKRHVYMRLVSRDRNCELLRNTPYDEYLDMAVSYYYVIEVSEDSRGILLITNEHLNLLGITKEELRVAARENTIKNSKPKISGMNEMLVSLGKRLGIPIPREYSQNCMYILSNETGTYGAVCMMLSEALECFAQEIRSSFFILPSSVHEVLLVPDTGRMTAEIFSGMVKEVNATQIEDCEVLTDSVYYYDREIHAVRRVA